MFDHQLLLSALTCRYVLLTAAVAVVIIIVIDQFSGSEINGVQVIIDSSVCCHPREECKTREGDEREGRWGTAEEGGIVMEVKEEGRKFGKRKQK